MAIKAKGKKVKRVSVNPWAVRAEFDRLAAAREKAIAEVTAVMSHV